MGYRNCKEIPWTIWYDNQFALSLENQYVVLFYIDIVLNKNMHVFLLSISKYVLLQWISD